MDEPVVIGPFITAFGFKSWFWACRPEMLVAAPGGFGVAIRAAMTTGGIGGVAGALGEAAEQKAGGKVVDRLLSATDVEVQSMSNAVVYKVSDLQSIKCKKLVMGTNPDFVVTTKDGKSKKYGLGNALAFDAVVEALRGCFGEVVEAS